MFLFNQSIIIDMMVANVATLMKIIVFFFFYSVECRYTPNVKDSFMYDNEVWMAYNAQKKKKKCYFSHISAIGNTNQEKLSQSTSLN